MEQAWYEVLLQIFNTYIVPALLTSFGAFFTWVIAYLKTKIADKADTDMKKFVVKEVVRCIAQTFEGTGQEKLKEAIKRCTEWLATKKIEVSEAELVTLIESSWYEVKNILTEPILENKEE